MLYKKIHDIKAVLKLSLVSGGRFPEDDCKSYFLAGYKKIKLCETWKDGAFATPYKEYIDPYDYKNIEDYRTEAEKYRKLAAGRLKNRYESMSANK